MRNTLSALFCVLIGLPLAATAQEYMERKIEISAVREPTVVSVPIHTLGMAGKNFGIQKADGSAVAFQRVHTNENLLLHAEILESPDAGMEGPRSNKRHTTDGNPDTIFRPVTATEHTFVFRTESYVVPEYLYIQLQTGTIQDVRVRQGDTKEQLTLSYNGSPSAARIPLLSVQARVFEITLATQDTLDIAEIQLLKPENFLLFQALPQEKYFLVPNSAPAAEALSYEMNAATPVSLEPVRYEGTSTDSDGDGVPDDADNCARDANGDQKDSDGDGMGDACDIAPLVPNIRPQDSDKDGISDAEDNCPDVPNSDQADPDGDGIGWACDDADNDGIANATDNCVGVFNPHQEDSDGDGLGDACGNDEDRDGIVEADNCPHLHNSMQEDADGDGIGTLCDVCPFHYDPLQEDADGNGIGDACQQIGGSGIQDTDRDGRADASDNCIRIANPDQKDTDKDNVGDACDNCPEDSNANQRDSNGDGTGDACTDTDGDGITDTKDNCPADANPNQSDSDRDGRGDPCDDEDKDRIPNGRDNCPNVENTMQSDGDNDGIGDACDDHDNRTPSPIPWFPFAMGAAFAGVMAVRITRHTPPTIGSGPEGLK